MLEEVVGEFAQIANANLRLIDVHHFAMSAALEFEYEIGHVYENTQNLYQLKFNANIKVNLSSH